MKLFKLNIYIFLIIILISTFTLSFSEENHKCFSTKSNNILEEISDSEIPYKILYEIDNYKKFQINNLKILTSTGTIRKKFKKRFSGKVKIFYKEKICNFKAGIRIHGDFKDHINWIDGDISQSLDVHLKEGNINGITKFKLLLPRTRNNPEEEIILTEIFRSLDILSPKTFFIKADNNGFEYTTLFQEKIEKEFLEFNQRKESVILEGDERFIFDNNDTNIDWKAKLISLAKISNYELLEKSKNYKEILFSSLSQLNKFYLNKNNYYESGGVYYYDHTRSNNREFTNSELSTQKKNFLIFDSLIFATNSQHALNPHNRKFYWNKEYQEFEPVYYDGNVDVDKAIEQKNLPKYKEFYEGILLTLNHFNKINIEILIKDISKNFNNVELENNFIRQKLEKIISNLKKINQLSLEGNKETLVKQESVETKLNHLKNYFSRINKDIFPIFLDYEFKNFYKCSINKCEIIEIEDKEILSLINGILKKNNNYHQFVGLIKINNSKPFFNFKLKNEYLKIFNYKNSKIIYNDDEYLIKKLDSNSIFIKQLIPNKKLIITGGNLESLKISADLILQEKNTNKKSFDIRGLTGCINLIDLELKDVEIEILNGNCEDGVNIIRSKGTIKKIFASNSTNDAIDIDFSNIEIKEMNISNSGNDCLDLSYGHYKILMSNIKDCGDKSISVGEKSKLHIQNLITSNSNIGIASKDSSFVKLEKGIFNNVKTCLAAYRKKQEFLGAIIKVEKFKCLNFSKKIEFDNVSMIKFK